MTPGKCSSTCCCTPPPYHLQRPTDLAPTGPKLALGAHPGPSFHHSPPHPATRLNTRRPHTPPHAQENLTTAPGHRHAQYRPALNQPHRRSPTAHSITLVSRRGREDHRQGARLRNNAVSHAHGRRVRAHIAACRSPVRVAQRGAAWVRSQPWPRRGRSAAMPGLVGRPRRCPHPGSSADLHADEIGRRLHDRAPWSGTTRELERTRAGQRRSIGSGDRPLLRLPDRGPAAGRQLPALRLARRCGRRGGGPAARRSPSR
jgi:hypothetical protein